jgi:type III secretory pathway component EscS
LFGGTWIILMVTSVFLFWIKKDVVFKRKWFPRFVILVGVLFVAFSSTIMVLQQRSVHSLKILVVIIPAVILSSWLNLKLTKFCGSCGATIINNVPFSRTRFCPKCGAELAAEGKSQIPDQRN